MLLTGHCDDGARRKKIITKNRNALQCFKRVYSYEAHFLPSMATVPRIDGVYTRNRVTIETDRFRSDLARYEVGSDEQIFRLFFGRPEYMYNNIR